MKAKFIGILLFVSACTSLWFLRGYIHFGKVQKEIKHDIVYSNSNTEHWIGEYNREHAKASALEEDRATANALHSKEIHQAALDIGQKDKQIEGLQRLVAKLKGSFTEPVDTTKRGDTTSSFVHTDSFSKFNGVIVNNKETITYDINVPVVLNPYWKRAHHFLGIQYGNIEHYIDGHSDNPNVHLDSLSDIRILQKRPGRFGIGPYLGIPVNENIFKENVFKNVSIGVALTYSLIRF